jgi:hypothetical protein
MKKIILALTMIMLTALAFSDNLKTAIKVVRAEEEILLADNSSATWEMVEEKLKSIEKLRIDYRLQDLRDQGGPLMLIADVTLRNKTAELIWAVSLDSDVSQFLGGKWGEMETPVASQAYPGILRYFRIVDD